MGLSLRIFLFDDDDSIHRLPLSHYERLLKRDPEERFPQYAGKRVRYIIAMIDLLNRKPVEILSVRYSCLHFNSEGLIDPDKVAQEIRDYVQILPPEPIIRYPWDSVRPKRTLPEKNHEGKWHWTPSPEIETTIVKAVFESN